MQISRLRLRLAAWFGAAFLLGLLVLDLGLLVYANRKAEAKLTRDVRAAVRNLGEAIRGERDARPAAPADSIVNEVLGEWPAGPDVIAVYDSTGRRLGARGDSSLVELVGATALPEDRDGMLYLPVNHEGRLRVAWMRQAVDPGATIVAGISTSGAREDLESLVGWLLLSIPLIGLGATAAGYALARRALGPVQAMAAELDAIDPERIDRRLPTGTPPDELDQLASHFNGLLDRLAGARETSRRFLAQAAHQLRTPLTVVRGESALGLDRPRTPDDYRAALRRINLAAEQMSRRVNELFLLAEAEAGERPALTDRVELDGLLMEAADLMRGRATGLGRSLEFGTMDDVQVLGAESLLREAAMELLENACRHGTAERPVQITVVRLGDRARVEVSNAGPPFPEAPTQGLGLSIVRWVAEIHGGTMGVERRGPLNTVTIDLPAGVHTV
jgi:signal transduction histidine kinase